MNFNFGEVLSRAGQIVWKHRVLWIFGILAGCTRGNSNFNIRGNVGGNGGTPNLPPQLQQLFETFSRNMTGFIAITIAIVCILWIVAISLGTLGKIGLIRGTWLVDTGTDHLIFGELFSESMPYFWRMFGLSLLAALPAILVVVALAAALASLIVPVASRGSDSATVALLGIVPVMIGCFCLLIPVMFVIGTIVRQAENAIVLEDAGVLPSLSRGWEVFRNNLGVILLLAIILIVIGMAVGFILAIPVFIVVLPSVFAFASGQGQNWNPLIFSAICFCLYLPILWVLNGILTAYIESTWTLTYMRLTKPQDHAPVLLETHA